GGKPEIGKRAAEETKDLIAEYLADTDMVFITAGMGGGTGTGAAPVIAELAHDMGILTVGVVTKPFDFEGPVRMKYALEGIEELRKHVDTLIIIPNEKLLDIVDEEMSIVDALHKADEVLRQGVQGISDLVLNDGLINLDFADVKSVMLSQGVAHMGVGRASGKNKTDAATEYAINSPLLETSINGAKSVLLCFAGDSSLTLIDVVNAAKIVRNAADPNVFLIFGAIIKEELKDEVIVTVIATGLGELSAENKNVRKQETDTQTDAHKNEPRGELRPIREADEDDTPFVLPEFLLRKRN
ncbi:MAG: cell division protein FtsZ, partial [Defluviitaleaceae bacterium]|nr:cell division protein FtsZ [Defluviitaleaceae bacterium]